MNTSSQLKRWRNRAFTLIELLAVIAIMGIITAMIVQLAPAVNQNKKKQRVDAEKNKLILFIDSYQSKFGHYPPDNANLTLPGKQPMSPLNYDTYTQLNPLLYELTGGGTNNFRGGSSFAAFDGSVLPQTDISSVYGFQGILNADTESQVIFKPLPSPSVYMGYPTWLSLLNNTNLQGLVVPVEMVQILDPRNKGSGIPTAVTTTNFWHYDASSTNRHNPSSYDLWAEFVIGKNKAGWIYVTNGNW